MKILVVLEFDVPSAEQVAGILLAMNPPSLPHFAGTANIVVEPHASELREWLEEEL